jgi:hypothetical protein
VRAVADSTDDAARAFYEVSKRLKTAEKGVRAEFHKAIREAAKPLLPAVRAEAAARFPKRGGLNRHMAKGSRYRVAQKTGQATAGVSIRANRTDPRVDEQGRIAHPIPARNGAPVLDAKGRRVMVVQYFPQVVGFFSQTIEGHADSIRDDMIDRLQKWTAGYFSGLPGG